jgi:hypothetical protein
MFFFLLFVPGMALVSFLTPSGRHALKRFAKGGHLPKWYWWASVIGLLAIFGGVIGGWVAAGAYVVIGGLVLLVVAVFRYAFAAARDETLVVDVGQMQLDPREQDQTDYIRNLAALREDGLITTEEFEAKKKQLLGL